MLAHVLFILPAHTCFSLDHIHDLHLPQRLPHVLCIGIERRGPALRLDLVQHRADNLLRDPSLLLIMPSSSFFALDLFFFFFFAEVDEDGTAAPSAASASACPIVRVGCVVREVRVARGVDDLESPRLLLLRIYHFNGPL